MNSTTGTLTKLRIESYSDEKYKTLEGAAFEAMFNPDKYTTKYEINYDEKQASGTAFNAPSFSNMKSQELTLEFFLDGTGVATEKVEDVQTKVDGFLEKAYQYDGKIHRNRYLRVIWSALVFDCVLKTADIQCSLFDSSGKPLRAKITARFVGFVNDELRERKEDASSPDLTHVRTVKGRDRIDAMTDRIYQTPEYYIDVARVNTLTNFRKLKAGRQLAFPPLKVA